MTIPTLPALPALSAAAGGPLLALLPHGLQHGSRRNAYRAMEAAAARRRDRQAAEAAVAGELAAQARTATKS